MIDERLNTNAAYTDADRANIARVNAWLESGHTGAELSRLTGIKEGTRSSILNGSYVSSPTAFLTKMLDSINRADEREKAGQKDIPYTLTSVANTLNAACARAHADRDFGFYAGRPGIGKTTACREYVRKTPSAVLIEAFDGIDHTTFIGELTAATGAAVAKGTVSQQMAHLIRALRGTDKLIVVDEANWLPKRSFGALRRISDIAEIGIMLVGTAELLQILQDPDGRFGQISSRIGYWPHIARQINDQDADLMIEAFLGQRPADEVVKAFCECCEGSARTLRNLLRGSYRYANKNKIELSAELVRGLNAKNMGGRGFLKGGLA